MVTVYGSGEADGTLFLATQFVEGVTLEELLRQQPGGEPLPLVEALEYLHEIASALDFAHSREFVHRDVKPGNVLIGLVETPHRAVPRGLRRRQGHRRQRQGHAARPLPRDRRVRVARADPRRRARRPLRRVLARLHGVRTAHGSLPVRRRSGRHRPHRRPPPVADPQCRGAATLPARIGRSGARSWAVEGPRPDALPRRATSCRRSAMRSPSRRSSSSGRRTPRAELPPPAPPARRRWWIPAAIVGGAVALLVVAVVAGRTGARRRRCRSRYDLGTVVDRARPRCPRPPPPVTTASPPTAPLRPRRCRRSQRARSISGSARTCRWPQGWQVAALGANAAAAHRRGHHGLVHRPAAPARIDRS